MFTFLDIQGHLDSRRFKRRAYSSNNIISWGLGLRHVSAPPQAPITPKNRVCQRQHHLSHEG